MYRSLKSFAEILSVASLLNSDIAKSVTSIFSHFIFHSAFVLLSFFNFLKFFLYSCRTSVLRNILATVHGVINAERVCLFLVDSADNTLQLVSWCVYSRNIHFPLISICFAYLLSFLNTRNFSNPE